MIKVNFKRKRILGIFLAAAIVASVIGTHQLQAAGWVDKDEPITITAKVDSGDTSIFATEFDGTVEVEIYKIADIDERGYITGPTNKFSGSDIDFENLKTDTVEAIKKGIVEKAITTAENVDPDDTIKFDRSQGATSAKTTNESLKPGLYLYLPKDVMDDRYAYSFTPYVILAPYSDYVANANDDGIWEANSNLDDEWNYNPSFYLKSTATPRFGDLEITKTLNNFNESLGDQSFVYYVKGVLENDLDDPNDDEVVVDTVYKIDFSGAEAKTRTIEHIPATAKVTVTEGYPGSSYEPTENTEMTQTVTIIGNEVVGVEFANTYNGNNISGGIAAENHFEVEEGEPYYVEPTPMPTPTPYTEDENGAMR